MSHFSNQFLNLLSFSLSPAMKSSWKIYAFINWTERWVFIVVSVHTATFCLLREGKERGRWLTPSLAVARDLSCLVTWTARAMSIICCNALWATPWTVSIGTATVMMPGSFALPVRTTGIFTTDFFFIALVKFTQIFICAFVQGKIDVFPDLIQNDNGLRFWRSSSEIY